MKLHLCVVPDAVTTVTVHQSDLSKSDIVCRVANMIISVIMHAHTLPTNPRRQVQSRVFSVEECKIFVGHDRPFGQQSGAHPGGAVVPLQDPVLRGLVEPSERRVGLSAAECF